MSGDYTGYFCAGNFNGATISKFAQKVRDEETQHVARALIANTDEAIIHLLNREAQFVLMEQRVRRVAATGATFAQSLPRRRFGLAMLRRKDLST